MVIIRAVRIIIAPSLASTFLALRLGFTLHCAAGCPRICQWLSISQIG